MKKLVRSRTTRVFGGVAGGLADYLGIDVTVMRLVFVLVGVMVPNTVLAYLLAWIIIPEGTPGEVFVDYREVKEDKSTGRTADEIMGEKVSPDAEPEPELVTEEEYEEMHRRRREYLGYALIAIGGILLLRQFIPRYVWRFPIQLMKTWWPLAIVGLGLALIFGVVRGR